MSLKRIFCLAAAACLTVSAAVFADTPQPPEISAHAAYVMDADTGDTLYAKNADDRAYPGSTTKIMTGILGVELGKAQGKMDQPLNITNDVYNIESDASVLGIDPGDQITLRHALTGMMTVSGCDAAVAVAETVTPTQADFVAKMNEKAAALGCTNTHFANPHGLPDSDHYSTARDMATIAAYGMKMPEFRDMVSHSEYDMPYINGGSKHCTTTNYFLTSGFPGANGIKTGTTNAGGPCLVASATQDGRTVIASIMNSDDRFGDAQKLMAYGFSVLKPVEPAENVYILRQAPAGQTLSDIKKKQAQAAELASQQKQEAVTAAASTAAAKAPVKTATTVKTATETAAKTAAKTTAKTAAKADTAKTSKPAVSSQPYVPFSPAA